MKLKSSCASCFAGLSCRTRIEMVNLLRGKKMSVGEIAGYFKLRQPTITHHLQYLKEAGVVGSERRGRRVYYFITEKCKKGECGLFI